MKITIKPVRTLLVGGNAKRPRRGRPSPLLASALPLALNVTCKGLGLCWLGTQESETEQDCATCEGSPDCG